MSLAFSCFSGEAGSVLVRAPVPLAVNGLNTPCIGTNGIDGGNVRTVISCEGHFSGKLRVRADLGLSRVMGGVASLGKTDPVVDSTGTRMRKRTVGTFCNCGVSNLCRVSSFA